MSLESSEKYHDSSEKALKAEPTSRFYVLYDSQLNFGFSGLPRSRDSSSALDSAFIINRCPFGTSRRRIENASMSSRNPLCGRKKPKLAITTCLLTRECTSSLRAHRMQKQIDRRCRYPGRRSRLQYTMQAMTSGQRSQRSCRARAGASSYNGAAGGDGCDLLHRPDG